jgi:hypothetical protein
MAKEKKGADTKPPNRKLGIKKEPLADLEPREKTSKNIKGGSEPMIWGRKTNL